MPRLLRRPSLLNEMSLAGLGRITPDTDAVQELCLSAALLSPGFMVIRLNTLSLIPMPMTG